MYMNTRVHGDIYDDDFVDSTVDEDEAIKDEEEDCDKVFEYSASYKRALNKKKMSMNTKIAKMKDREIADTIAKIDKLESEVGQLELLVQENAGVACGLASNEWTLMSITIDSGASETVCNDNDFQQFDVRVSEGSRNGVQYRDASGNPISNLGEKRVGFVTEQGQKRNMMFQVCDVSKPLASVSRICKKGHRIVFEEGANYILNLESGDITWLREENGVYLMDVWLPPASDFPRQGM